jgi:peptide/nickel transport system permease protein
MLRYVLRRLAQSALTIFGLMIIPFLLFRVGAGDIAAANLGQKATEQRKAEWRHRHGYDLPWVFNCHRRLLIRDRTQGARPLMVADPGGSAAADALALMIVRGGDGGGGDRPGGELNTLMGRYVAFADRDTPRAALTDGAAMVQARPAGAAPAEAPATQPATASAPATAPTTAPGRPDDGEVAYRPLMEFSLADGSSLRVDLSGANTVGEVIERINTHPDNAGRLEARLSDWRPWQLLHSQFFHHLVNSITFQSRSFQDNRKLTQIIAEHAPFSLSITVPALAARWLLAMIISCYVAYYRGGLGDKVGVFLSVLGMCVPFLAFMILGQWLMFELAPAHAYGLLYRGNIYLPVGILVIASLGGSVRFYRTVILDETHRDYVRTARAKGVPLPAVLFKHVLKNCMLPILTNLIMAIPFLILGSLLLEKFFGIPGLGDLMLTSITDRNEPILSGLVFLTALIYTLSILITDLSYALFDPRIRLQ